MIIIIQILVENNIYPKITNKFREELFLIIVAQLKKTFTESKNQNRSGKDLAIPNQIFEKYTKLFLMKKKKLN